MWLQKQAIILSFASVCLSFTKNVVQGAAPGERSKEMCKKYLQYVPKSYDCPFLTKSLAIGNEFAEEEEFPHMGILGYEKEGEIRWACSATLISDQYILAAGHCLNTTDYGNPTVVRLGVTNLTDTVHRQDIKVAEVIKHPDYRLSQSYNDMGLVKLEKKVDINVRTRPACLFTEKKIDTTEAVNSGWGTTDFLGEFNNGLQKAVLELYDLESCNKTYKRRPESGGPLTIIHKEDGDLTCIYDVIGVASFGKLITTKDVPSVYTRVSAYIKWIEDNVWK